MDVPCIHTLDPYSLFSSCMPEVPLPHAVRLRLKPEVDQLTLHKR
jgi:hypothetical protein